MPGTLGGGGRPPNAAEREETAWDQYMGHALAAIITVEEIGLGPRGIEPQAKDVARVAAKVADAMLAERRERYPQPSGKPT